MTTIPFKVKKLTETAELPERANEGDLYDLFVDSFCREHIEESYHDEYGGKSCHLSDDGNACLLFPGDRILVKTGIALELPKYYQLYVQRGDSKALNFDWYFENDYDLQYAEQNLIEPIRTKQYAVADIRPRSGLALKHGITVLNTPGTIDNSYRKEIGVIIYNAGQSCYTIRKGHKIAQMLIRSLYSSQMQVVEEFNDTGRDGFGSTGNKKMTKLLTYEEAKVQADYCHWYEEGVYEYKINKKYTLIEHGKILIQDVDWCEWSAKGVYIYELDSKYTLTEHGKILAQDVDYYYQYREGVYEYKLDDKYTLIEHGKILIQDADWCYWYAKGVYNYTLNGEHFRVNLNEEQDD
jgi:dUTP pyrophosphatase